MINKGGNALISRLQMIAWVEGIPIMGLDLAVTEPKPKNIDSLVARVYKAFASLKIRPRLATQDNVTIDRLTSGSKALGGLICII